VILLPVTSTVLSGWITPLATSITETWVIAIAFWAAGPPQAAPASNATGTAQRTIWSCALLARFPSVVRLSSRTPLQRAGDRTRTGDVQLGKLAFYQLNYARESETAALVARRSRGH
jgi:hypothetical protein